MAAETVVEEVVSPSMKKGAQEFWDATKAKASKYGNKAKAFASKHKAALIAAGVAGAAGAGGGYIAGGRRNKNG